MCALPSAARSQRRAWHFFQRQHRMRCDPANNARARGPGRCVSQRKSQNASRADQSEPPQSDARKLERPKQDPFELGQSRTSGFISRVYRWHLRRGSPPWISRFARARPRCYRQAGAPVAPTDESTPSHVRQRKITEEGDETPGGACGAKVVHNPGSVSSADRVPPRLSLGLRNSYGTPCPRNSDCSRQAIRPEPMTTASYSVVMSPRASQFPAHHSVKKTSKCVRQDGRTRRIVPARGTFHPPFVYQRDEGAWLRNSRIAQDYQCARARAPLRPCPGFCVRPCFAQEPIRVNTNWWTSPSRARFARHFGDQPHQGRHRNLEDSTPQSVAFFARAQMCR